MVRDSGSQLDTLFSVEWPGGAERFGEKKFTGQNKSSGPVDLTRKNFDWIS
jgi:hypothetical protein